MLGTTVERDEFAGMEKDSLLSSEEVERERSNVVAEQPEGAVHMRLENVRRWWSSGSAIVSNDVIIAVRAKYHNPHQRVVLDTDMPLAWNELKGQFIFQTDEESEGIAAFASDLAVAVEVKDNDYTELADKIVRDKAYYELSSFRILLFGENKEMVRDAWEYLCSRSDISERIYVEPEANKLCSLKKNGIDIAKFCNALGHKADIRALTPEAGKAILAPLWEATDPARGENRVIELQSPGSTRDIFFKWVTVMGVYEHGLPPHYEASFAMDHLDTGVGYPVSKLSLYERVKFLRDMPEWVGYLDKNALFDCLGQVSLKICPTPKFVYKMDGSVAMKAKKYEQSTVHPGMLTIPEGEFNLLLCDMLDYKQLFTDKYFAESSGLYTPDDPEMAGLPFEENVDANLMKIFENFMETFGIDDTLVTVYNTVLVYRDDGYWLAYMDEPLGIVLGLCSAMFGRYEHTMFESDFWRLIDRRFVTAIAVEEWNKFDDGVGFGDGNMLGDGKTTYRELIASSYQSLVPPIPPSELMYMTVAPAQCGSLPYYDRMLRCTARLTPVTTHPDSQLSNAPNLANKISITSILRDPMARKYITSFGCRNIERLARDLKEGVSPSLDYLPVTIDSFKGVDLLDSGEQ